MKQETGKQQSKSRKNLVVWNNQIGMEMLDSDSPSVKRNGSSY